ncbi:MAG: ATP-binding protein [Candidatus Accumulibacter sp.]|jgi:predicted AAA+ superfamily ATPase|nr:ATP-binding protein [Accumulibacter sp.]
MIERQLNGRLLGKLGAGKAIVLTGARQTGKTTLLRTLFAGRPETLWLDGDEPDVRALFENLSSTRLKAILGAKSRLVIDEAQRLPEAGLRLKLITDSLPEVQLIATGSSSFELSNQVNEPLTGRKWEFQLYPLSFAEMTAHHGLLEEKRLLPHRLIYGGYPEVVTHPGEERERLLELANSYLYKDILMLGEIKKPDKLTGLLQALALQVGSQVSYNELAQLCGLDNKTVEKYIMVLEKAYIVFRLGSFARNLRNELKFSRKIYFYDNGIRNAVLANFAQIEARDDIGALWENYLVSERLKFLKNGGDWSRSWFWRTQQQKEVDYLEEKDGRLDAYEFKWNPSAKATPPRQFTEAYPESRHCVVHPGNYEDFLLPGA